MFVKVRINGDLAKGSVVSHNATSQLWDIAPNSTSLCGVIESTQQDDELVWWGAVRLGNATYALADRAIPDEGGFLNVVNGKVFVDNTGDHKCGVIAPLARGQSARAAGDLVMIYLR